MPIRRNSWDLIQLRSRDIRQLILIILMALLRNSSKLFLVWISIIFVFILDVRHIPLSSVSLLDQRSLSMQLLVLKPIDMRSYLR